MQVPAVAIGTRNTGEIPKSVCVCIQVKSQSVCVCVYTGEIPKICPELSLFFLSVLLAFLLLGPVGILVHVCMRVCVRQCVYR